MMTACNIDAWLTTTADEHRHAFHSLQLSQPDQYFRIAFIFTEFSLPYRH